MRRIVAMVIVPVALVLGLGACAQSGGSSGGSSGGGGGGATASTVPPTVNTDAPISRARNGVDALNKQQQQLQQQAGSDNPTGY
jgi:hypothetical protein